MIHSRDITTEAEAAVLEHADRLAAIIGKHWHPTDDTAQDDVMLLVADLLRAHAETGIEMQTWRSARPRTVSASPSPSSQAGDGWR